ncbi:MAG: type II toxin-antitoxin system RelE/ParE family toxin [Gammaproteobacteria bacterium]
MQVLFYRLPSGRNPVQEHIRGLPVAERAVIDAALKEIGEKGLAKARVSTRHIDGKLWELRFPSQRIFYFVMQGGSLVLLHIYKKQGQRAPVREIELAKNRMREVQNG